MGERIAVDDQQWPARWRSHAFGRVERGAVFAGLRRTFAAPSSPRAARPTPGRDRWRLRSRGSRDRRRPRGGALPLARSAADDRCAARRRAASGFACSPRTCTSARRDGACGLRRPTLGRGYARNSGAAFRLEERVLRIGRGGIDVAVRRHDIVVARKHDRDVRAVELLRHGLRAASSTRACTRIWGRAAGCRSAHTARRSARRARPPRCSGFPRRLLSPGSCVRVTMGSQPRARIATPFHDF